MKDKRRGKNAKNMGPRINDAIRIPEVRLVSEEQAFGIVSIEEARRIASDEGLDLVEISPNARPPVVKLIDYGKFKYDQQKRANEAKKKQAQVQLKETQFRPNIEAHDLDVKVKRIHKFLIQGDKIKLVMQFRGREMAYRDSGLKKFKNIIGEIVDFGAVVESEPKMMGNRIISILAPDKKALKRHDEVAVESETITEEVVSPATS